MSKVIHRYFPEPHKNPAAPTQTKKDNKKIVAAITAAIAHHRQG
jgi:oxaloacetate decarboxylase gamma subunit